MKAIDLIIGIKAEQTLRDAARTAAEEGATRADSPELCPVGKKDWVAGERIGSTVRFGELEPKRNAVLARLIDLQSHQRIRQESLRIYAVRAPVPVFKDPMPEETVERSQNERASNPETVACPVCGTEVHNYNIQYDPWGKMVGCYICRGESNSKDGESS